MDVGLSIRGRVHPMARAAWHEAAQAACLWPYLPLLFPYYLLTSAAAWLALYDLILRPYHWHKTEHGLAKTSRQAMLTLAARAAAAKANLL